MENIEIVLFALLGFSLICYALAMIILGIRMSRLESRVDKLVEAMYTHLDTMNQKISRNYSDIFDLKFPMEKGKLVHKPNKKKKGGTK